MKRRIAVIISLALASAPAFAGGEFYLAPEGSDSAEGNREAPLATISEALKRLPKGGDVILRGGVYRESIIVEETPGVDAPLTLRAAEGEEVVFDGGAPISEWRQEEGGPDLYSAVIPKGMSLEALNNLYLWDRKKSVRLIRAMDEAGVHAWPNTFVLTREQRLLIHLPGGKPEYDGLECNRLSRGIVIQRPNITIHGIAFRNFFLNGYSAALSVGRVKNVTITDCRMENVIRAVYVTPEAEEVRVLRCEIRNAGTAIASSGNWTTVEDCIIEGAQGAFAIHELLPILRCGIRIYHPAVGATVRRNLTSGFAYGLRIKSREYEEGHDWPPFEIHHNTFLDGISITPPVMRWFNKGSHFARNVIGTDHDGPMLLDQFSSAGISIEENFLFHRGADHDEGALKADPFRNLAGGDPRLKEGTALPEGFGAPQREVRLQATATPTPSPKASPAYRSIKRKKNEVATLHVRAGAASKEADGSAAHPYPTLQPALDQVEPGDTVLIHKGLYAEPAVLTRSGAAGKPITLKGEGAEETLLDGGRSTAVLLAIRGSKHVKVEGLTFRWFEETGLEITASPHVTVEKCRFFNAELNSRGAAIGFGIFGERSPHLTITQSIFARNRVGMKLVNCPDTAIRQNTAFRNLNTALEMVRSCSGSAITHNSFGFSSHAAIYLWEPNLTALESLECDYNNYAMRLYHYRKYQEGTEAPTNVLDVPARYGPVSGGKAVVDVLISQADDKPRARYHDLASWQAAHGKDAHSLFADPGYRAPLEGDFRLLPDSPNRLEAGERIGAGEAM